MSTREVESLAINPSAIMAILSSLRYRRNLIFEVGFHGCKAFFSLLSFLDAAISLPILVISMDPLDNSQASAESLL